MTVPVARALGAGALLLLAACGAGAAREAAARTGGDVERGRALLAGYACGSCHAIPGVRNARATVGPSLAGIAGRSYVAGVIPNTPDAMIRWIMDPPAIDSLTAMPNVGVSATDARDMAAYLYTLR